MISQLRPEVFGLVQVLGNMMAQTCQGQNAPVVEKI